MSHCRRFYSILSTGLAVTLALLAAPRLLAAEPAAVACHGNDMLAELATRSPALYQRVISEGTRLPNSEAVLWKVDKTGVASSYLLGTVHMSDSRISVLTPKAKDAIDHSTAVALEVADLSDTAVSSAMKKAAHLITYGDGQSLDGQLSSDDYKKVQTLVAKSGMPGEFAGMLRPWLVNMLVAMSDCERKNIASGAPILDLRVAAEAKHNGLTIQGLETVEDQLEALASIPDDQQVAMLKVSLKYLDRSDDLSETMVQMYLKRQIGSAMPFQEALAAEQGVPPTIFDGFRKALLIDRNVRMRDAAKPLFDHGSAFVAIGALHLSGPQGLIALLRETGYTVSPVE